MNYEELYTSRNRGVSKTFRELSSQLITDLGGKDEEHYLTRFKYYNPGIYNKLKNFRYDKDKILNLITQVTLSFKMCTSTICLDQPLKSFISRRTLFNIITDPIVLLSDESCYQCNLYTDIVNYYYIIKLLNIPSTEIENKAMDFARTIFNELVYNTDKFKKDISENPTDHYIDSSNRRKSLIMEKLKRDKNNQLELSFERLSNELCVNSVSIMHDFPVTMHTFNNFPYDKSKVITFLNDYLEDSHIQNLEHIWIDVILLKPIKILSNDTVQKDDYLDMINYYYRLEHILEASTISEAQTLLHIVRSIRNTLQYYPDTFGTNNNKNTNAVNSNVKLVPIERKDNFSSLFQNISFIRKDMIGGNSKVPMFYKVLDCDDSAVRYKIHQAHDVAVAVVRNPIYSSLIIEPIKSDNMDTLKYEVKFGMNHLENDDVVIDQLDGEGIYTFDQYLICTQLRLNKDYQLTWIELKGDFELKHILNVSHSKGPFDMIQIGIRWPFGIDSLNTALRNGHMTFILTIMKSM